MAQQALSVERPIKRSDHHTAFWWFGRGIFGAEFQVSKRFQNPVPQNRVPHLGFFLNNRRTNPPQGQGNPFYHGSQMLRGWKNEALSHVLLQKNKMKPTNLNADTFLEESSRLDSHFFCLNLRKMVRTLGRHSWRVPLGRHS